MRNLILVRGLPGSGKSTFGDLLGEPIASDDYFMNDGIYEFDASKLRVAHELSRLKCENQMKENKPIIVVTNTFTREWEMKPYFNLAKDYNYRIFTVIVENRHDGTNIHEVPSETIEAMKNRFQIKL